MSLRATCFVLRKRPHTQSSMDPSLLGLLLFSLTLLDRFSFSSLTFPYQQQSKINMHIPQYQTPTLQYRQSRLLIFCLLFFQGDLYEIQHEINSTQFAGSRLSYFPLSYKLFNETFLN
ncbi:Hypothetical_protein [Hexamita inflata]|uniref:Hypothetical_protein n=1 Tax=Hexamita inflata TaxID=28002 RepID=A0AA86PY86_9EUKA|nr:Hypothetical protein HINF_LOCUS30039 [Hexamita inflata]